MRGQKFRIRRGWFNKAILQQLVSSPAFIGGHVDSSIRIYDWVDVEYDSAHYSEYYPDREKD